MGISQEMKDKVITELSRRLNEKKIDLKCPSCSHPNFSVVDGYTRRILNDSIKDVQITGLSVPSISVICDYCGYILDFSLGALGFLKDIKEEDKENAGSKH
jgi:hypothetical protein